jgi:hypothetical protein
VTWRLPALALLLALAATASGCIFDRADHPAACESNVDCDTGEYCYENLCIPGEGGGGAGGVAGPDADGGGSGTTGGDGGDGGAGSGATGGSGGSGAMDGGGGTGATDAASGNDADVDASQPVDAGNPVAPYASCAADGDCNPGETCRLKNGAQGVCAAPCGSASDCSPPADGNAEETCGSDNQCTLACPTSVGGGPPTPAECPSGMTCVTEPADPSWLPGTPTCYPN